MKRRLAQMAALAAAALLASCVVACAPDDASGRAGASAQVSSAGAQDVSEQAAGAQAAGARDSAAFRNPDLGNGWQVQRSMPLEYAECFTVDYYDGGYKLACLSDGGRYLTVPAGADVPRGIDGDIVVLQQPLGDIYLVASDTMCLFDALDALDAISVSGIAQQDWKIPAAAQAMQAGSITYGGKYSAPDYDTLLAHGCRLSIQSTMINHTPEVREKLVELGIPVLTEQSSFEPEPLGRTEWVKLYGALLDREDAAAALFAEQTSQVAGIDLPEADKTVAFFYINSNGAAVVRKPGDYVAKMIDMAGGDYVFESLAADDTARSTVTMEMERFYAEAKDADVIVYNATIDAGADTIADLVGKNSLLANFKAVESGDVWVTEQSMYQDMMHTGQIVADFSKMLAGDDDGLAYLRKMRME